MGVDGGSGGGLVWVPVVCTVCKWPRDVRRVGGSVDRGRFHLRKESAAKPAGRWERPPWRARGMLNGGCLFVLDGSTRESSASGAPWSPRIIPLPPFLCHPAFPADLRTAPGRSGVHQRVVLNGKGMGAKEWSEGSRVQWSFLRPACCLSILVDFVMPAHTTLGRWVAETQLQGSFLCPHSFAILPFLLISRPPLNARESSSASF